MRTTATGLANRLVLLVGLVIFTLGAVREVASRVGYRQAAQFAKTFRRHHGRPPSSFRREGRAQGGARMSRDGGSPTEGGGNLDGDRPSLAYSTASA